MSEINKLPACLCSYVIKKLLGAFINAAMNSTSQVDANVEIWRIFQQKSKMFIVYT